MQSQLIIKGLAEFLLSVPFKQNRCYHVICIDNADILGL